ncbi:DUF2442 domain-containing protein [Desulfobotulus mexicanus]|uniref:DUF2442 domain-containing protein n=1 Tax=Desulfobotulus mexicanus TaxID=2586642 RepID=A0A5Q4VDQ3_9BACT|nr:DUF2442 domain-containing protein [Desulfobotulus mexicanus]TYT75829.1 DUF2442 domain-containing protein [Desulfobotulus mexicanus]
MLIDVVFVKPRKDFQLELEFANGEIRIFDMRPLIAVKPWNRIASPGIFQKASVEYGTVVWPGGIDVASDTLYLDGKNL